MPHTHQHPTVKPLKASRTRFIHTAGKWIKTTPNKGITRSTRRQSTNNEAFTPLNSYLLMFLSKLKMSMPRLWPSKINNHRRWLQWTETALPSPSKTTAARSHAPLHNGHQYCLLGFEPHQIEKIGTKPTKSDPYRPSKASTTHLHSKLKERSLKSRFDHQIWMNLSSSVTRVSSISPKERRDGRRQRNKDHWSRNRRTRCHRQSEMRTTMSSQSVFLYENKPLI